MIFTSASASGYDENITLIGITAEKGEVIRIGDTITIPMNDHTFEQREIIDMYRDWKKWKKGKDLFYEIKEGEWQNVSFRIFLPDVFIQSIPLTMKKYWNI